MTIQSKATQLRIVLFSSPPSLLLSVLLLSLLSSVVHAFTPTIYRPLSTAPTIPTSRPSAVASSRIVLLPTIDIHSVASQVTGRTFSGVALQSAVQNNNEGLLEPTNATDTSNNTTNPASVQDTPTTTTSLTTTLMKSFSQLSWWDKGLYAIGGTTSIFVSGTFFGTLCYQRDATMVSFFLGSIGNAVLSKVLKKLLNMDRPTISSSTSGGEGGAVPLDQPPDKGMPSSHAMSLGFIGTFTMMALPWTRWCIPPYVATSLYFRIRTNLHTVNQVAVGLVVGTLNGYLWKGLVDGTAVSGVCVADTVRDTVLDERGLLPAPLLAVPAFLGFVVVGSLEKKLSGWTKMVREQKDE